MTEARSQPDNLLPVCYQAGGRDLFRVGEALGPGAAGYNVPGQSVDRCGHLRGGSSGRLGEGVLS